MNKQPGYGLLLGLTVTAAVAAVVTLIPLPSNPANVLGYKSICVWAPWSTVMLVALAGTSCKLRSRFFKAR